MSEKSVRRDDQAKEKLVERAVWTKPVLGIIEASEAQASTNNNTDGSVYS